MTSFALVPGINTVHYLVVLLRLASAKNVVHANAFERGTCVNNRWKFSR